MMQNIRDFFYRLLIGNRIARKLENGTWEIRDGTRVWFISDLHFGHRRILGWCRKAFFWDLKHMHRRLISNWNHRVGNHDRVFCLGDFGDFRYFKYLNGRITMTKGNHDKKQWDLQHIVTYRDMRFLVLHDPDDPVCRTRWFDGDWVIHGHTHGNSPFIDIYRKRVNVSVEVINFTPLSMDELYRILVESRDYKANRPKL